MLKFIDNNKAMMLSGDPTMDPGFDEYDVIDEEENAKMTLKTLNELKKKYGIYDDAEAIFDFVSDVLYHRKKELEKNEPYAIRTINALENAEHEVYDLINYINELEEN